jgi:hypothetical protein
MSLAGSVAFQLETHRHLRSQPVLKNIRQCETFLQLRSQKNVTCDNRFCMKYFDGVT